VKVPRKYHPWRRIRRVVVSQWLVRSGEIPQITMNSTNSATKTASHTAGAEN